MKNRHSTLAAVVAAALVGFAAGYQVAPPLLQDAPFARGAGIYVIEPGFTDTNVTISGARVELTAACRRISFEVTEDQALSISYGLQKNVFSRPLTHDLARDIFDHFGLEMESAAIDAFEDDIYKAKIVVRQDDRVLKLDVRPSDAIALAVREKVPLSVKDSILESRGERIC
jgi:bifunctional DNase/RNase